jgi:hypothetical protein
MGIRRRFATPATAAAALTAIFLGSPQPAAAWWASGHATIAMMAYREMKPATRTSIDDILKQHPDYKNWLTELPSGVTDVQRGEYIFAIASTWPDRIKDAGDATVTIKFFNPGNKRNPPPKPYPSNPAVYPDLNVHDTWHYHDLPISMDGKTRTPPAEESIMTAIPTSRGNMAAAYLPGSYRAYYLSWLAHLVGDIHQPLHATGRFSAVHKEGDAGGNGIRFKSDGSQAQPRNLHAFWDSLLGNGPDPKRYNTLQNGWGEINTTIAAINVDSVRLLAGYDPATRENLDEHQWQQESFSAAQQFVYTFGDPDAARSDLPQPDTEYRRLALQIARQRAALAAHRLALICNEAFEKPAQP